MTEGKIKKITQKGFGFIEMPNGKDLFFHSSVVEGSQFEQLREGQTVHFNMGNGPKGPCAERVSPVENH